MRVKVDLNELRTLEGEVRRAVTALDHGSRILSDAVPGPQASAYGGDRVFGNTSAGSMVLTLHEWTALPAVKAAMKAFSGTVEADAERMEFAISLYGSMDAGNAERLLQSDRQGFDLVSVHLSNGGEHSELQARQIERLRALFSNGPMGNVVIGGDFNATSIGNGDSAQQIQKFRAEGFDVDAGRIDDGRGGTSASNIPIDHILPRGVGSTPAERWEREESDHDGQQVDVTLPAW